MDMKEIVLAYKTWRYQMKIDVIGNNVYFFFKFA